MSLVLRANTVSLVPTLRWHTGVPKGDGQGEGRKQFA